MLIQFLYKKIFLKRENQSATIFHTVLSQYQDMMTQTFFTWISNTQTFGELKKKSISLRQKVQWADSSNISLLLGEKTSWNKEETCFCFPKKKDMLLKSSQCVACLMHICWCKWNKLNIYDYFNFSSSNFFSQ